jgi:hypothetical protein
MTSTLSTLLFIDAHVDSYSNLAQGAYPDTEVIILDPDQDGVRQISQVLADRQGIESLQILCHGSEASLQLGAMHLAADNLSQYRNTLQGWGQALANDADILLYACNLAAGETGQAFVRSLSELTQATIAASENLTGSGELGGDWELEFCTGEIRSELAIAPEVLATYPGTLQNFTVSTALQLDAAIRRANESVENDTITLNADIFLGTALTAIASNIEFLGNGYTISGSNLVRVLTVNSGTVKLTELTIADGRAAGESGAISLTALSGGNGTSGQGGGLYINGGDVTTVNVTFTGNKAVGGKGGTSLLGTGGKGGDGQGGAIFVNGGSLRLSTTSFAGNVAEKGLGGSTAAGLSGIARGGAIFVNNAGGTVIAEGAPRYSSSNVNRASSDTGTNFITDNAFGTITTVTPPAVLSISRADLNPTASNLVAYTVTFSQEVTGVNINDFALTTSSGISGATLDSVTGSGSTYTVLVRTGTGQGTIRLDLLDDDTIQNSGTPLGSTGLGNGDRPGEEYTIDKIPPKVFSINRKSPDALTAAATVTYTVTFDMDVDGVDTTDFAVVSPTVIGATVNAVTKVSKNVYEVTVNTGTGNGDLGLNLVDNDSIVSDDTRRVSLGGVGLANGNFTGATYTLDKTPPVATSILRSGIETVNANSVAYTVAFSRDVTGVDATDFALVPSAGITGASITSVAAIDAKTYTVTVNTGSGDGTLGLNLVDDDSIKNPLGVVLADVGVGNGNITGQTFNILKSAPIAAGITLINPNPIAAGSVSYAVTFNQDVTGVDAADFTLVASGLTGASITSVTGSGKNYTVLASTGSGSGTLGLNLVDDDSIKNTVNSPLGGVGAGNGSFTGPSYNITKTPPRVASISRLEGSPTNAALVNFSVIFNENVLRVDAADFALATNIPSARIQSVTRVNGAYYTVAVSTGSSDGAIGLNLVDDDTIVNTLGIALGGVGRANGNFTGEAYTVDRTPPTLDIIDVSPKTRSNRVDAITLRFAEAVSGFDVGDLQLTRNGEAVPLKNASLSTEDGITWTLANTKKLTNRRGDYTLTVTATESGVFDAAGNPLNVNASDRWTNLVSVNADDAGITRRGTKRNDTLQGTDNADNLRGLQGNDILIGLDSGDTLIGGSGNDTLVSGDGQDVMKGGAGADRFVFAGSTQAQALAGSLVDMPDTIKGFNSAKGDRFQLDYDNNTRTSDRPSSLFNAGKINANSLEAAVKSVYGNRGSGKALGVNEAVLFAWQGQTYLSVNDGTAGFSENRDLVVGVSGMKFKKGDDRASGLAVDSYFA